MSDEMNEIHIKQATLWLQEADSIVIGAGAGMGVDSGLPDFRGSEGFWKAYPALKGYSFIDMANPQWFVTDPQKAWGFYGHRLNLYRTTQPHLGFEILRQWTEKKRDDYFIFTSNVDGQFQKAGFDDQKVAECHGSIHYVQSLTGEGGIYTASGIEVTVDEERIQAALPLPTHPHLSGTLRPNILMFGDAGWDPERTDAQEHRYHTWWRAQKKRRVLIIEMGAGTSIPSVRYNSERILHYCPHAKLIRINPREAQVPIQFKDRSIPFYAGALATLTAIDTYYRAALED